MYETIVYSTHETYHFTHEKTPIASNRVVSTIVTKKDMDILIPVIIQIIIFNS